MVGVAVSEPNEELLIFHSYFPTTIRVVELATDVSPALVDVTFIQQIPYEIPLFNTEVSDVNFLLAFDLDGFQSKAPCLVT